MATATFASILNHLLGGNGLSGEEVRLSFDAIFRGEWTAVQVASFAVALRARGETSDVIVAAAQSLRAAMSAVDHGLDVVVDTCGTGGDGAHTLNLSTAAALVVAARGLAVAKHGNRSVSSRCGSADVVEALGIPIDVAPHRQSEVLREAGIAFLFAPAHHPALRHAAQARTELGIRTIFNALGPLANPARATHQLVGVYDDALRPVVARALGTLGVRRAWVVRSDDGLDEISPSAPTRVSELVESGEVRELTISPDDFGAAAVDPRSLAGSDAKSNARAIERIVSGDGHPASDAVAINAAAALVVARNLRPRDAFAEAREALQRGGAMQILERWRQVARRAAP
jgi:anthranilate phosphoribosyltransferase